MLSRPNRLGTIRVKSYEQAFARLNQTSTAFRRQTGYEDSIQYNHLAVSNPITKSHLYSTDMVEATTTTRQLLTATHCKTTVLNHNNHIRLTSYTLSPIHKLVELNTQHMLTGLDCGNSSYTNYYAKSATSFISELKPKKLKQKPHVFFKPKKKKKRKRLRFRRRIFYKKAKKLYKTRLRLRIVILARRAYTAKQLEHRHSRARLNTVTTLYKNNKPIKIKISYTCNQKIKILAPNNTGKTGPGRHKLNLLPTKHKSRTKATIGAKNLKTKQRSAIKKNNPHYPQKPKTTKFSKVLNKINHFLKRRIAKTCKTRKLCLNSIRRLRQTNCYKPGNRRQKHITKTKKNYIKHRHINNYQALTKYPLSIHKLQTAVNRNFKNFNKKPKRTRTNTANHNANGQRRLKKRHTYKQNKPVKQKIAKTTSNQNTNTYNVNAKITSWINKKLKKTLNNRNAITTKLHRSNPNQPETTSSIPNPLPLARIANEYRHVLTKKTHYLKKRKSAVPIKKSQTILAPLLIRLKRKKPTITKSEKHQQAKQLLSAVKLGRKKKRKFKSKMKRKARSIIRRIKKYEKKTTLHNLNDLPLKLVYSIRLVQKALPLLQLNLNHREKRPKTPLGRLINLTVLHGIVKLKRRKTITIKTIRLPHARILKFLTKPTGKKQRRYQNKLIDENSSRAPFDVFYKIKSRNQQKHRLSIKKIISSSLKGGNARRTKKNLFPNLTLIKHFLKLPLLKITPIIQKNLLIPFRITHYEKLLTRRRTKLLIRCAPARTRYVLKRPLVQVYKLIRASKNLKNRFIPTVFHVLKKNNHLLIHKKQVLLGAVEHRKTLNRRK